MIEYLITLCICVIFVRLYLNKFNDLNGKDIISVVIAISITTFLTIIQMVIDFILNLIF